MTFDVMMVLLFFSLLVLQYLRDICRKKLWNAFLLLVLSNPKHRVATPRVLEVEVPHLVKRSSGAWLGYFNAQRVFFLSKSVFSGSLLACGRKWRERSRLVMTCEGNAGSCGCPGRADFLQLEDLFFFLRNGGHACLGGHRLL